VLGWPVTDITPQSVRCGASSRINGSHGKKACSRGGAGSAGHPDATAGWFNSQPDVVPEQLVFIHETCVSINMAHHYGRCWRGQRLRPAVRYGNWKTTTLIARLRLTGIVAPMMLDGPVNGRSFQTHVDRVRVPDLRPGEIVVMDNLGLHKEPGIQAAIEAAVVSPKFLPPLQPVLQPDRDGLLQA